MLPGDLLLMNVECDDFRKNIELGAAEMNITVTVGVDEHSAAIQLVSSSPWSLLSATVALVTIWLL